MKVVIVYESVYGNTHLVAEKLAEGINLRADAIAVPVGEATSEVLQGADLLIVGGPTHLHGLSTGASRKMAESDAEKKGIALDPDVESEGLRHWLHDLEAGTEARAAAFDTRLSGRPAFTGAASRGIARRLHNHGFTLVVEPESFLVDADNHLIEGEGERARQWAESLVVDWPVLERTPAVPVRS